MRVGALDAVYDMRDGHDGLQHAETPALLDAQHAQFNPPTT